MITPTPTADPPESLRSTGSFGGDPVEDTLPTVRRPAAEVALGMWPVHKGVGGSSLWTAGSPFADLRLGGTRAAPLHLCRTGLLHEVVATGTSGAEHVDLPVKEAL